MADVITAIRSSIPRYNKFVVGDDDDDDDDLGDDDGEPPMDEDDDDGMDEEGEGVRVVEDMACEGCE